MRRAAGLGSAAPASPHCYPGVQIGQGGVGFGVQDGVHVLGPADHTKAIRERNGWTQQEVADNLGRLTGHTLPQASISATERGFDGERRRRFDAHEPYFF